MTRKEYIEMLEAWVAIDENQIAKMEEIGCSAEFWKGCRETEKTLINMLEAEEKIKAPWED